MRPSSVCTSRVVRGIIVPFVAAPLIFASACGGAETDRERAIDAAKEAHGYAVSQGVDLQRTPCIGDPVIEGWVAVVASADADPDRAARACPSYDAGGIRNYVVLDFEGEVVAATE
jgi:hypothetical protein